MNATLATDVATASDIISNLAQLGILGYFLSIFRGMNDKLNKTAEELAELKGEHKAIHHRED